MLKDRQMINILTLIYLINKGLKEIYIHIILKLTQLHLNISIKARAKVNLFLTSLHADLYTKSLRKRFFFQNICVVRSDGNFDVMLVL